MVQKLWERLTPVEYAPDFADKYIKAIQDGCIPILISNHTSDFDGVAIAYLTRDLVAVANEHLPQERKLKNFLMITAGSLRLGAGRPLEKIMFDTLQPFLNKHNIEPIYTTTSNDKARRGMNGNRREFIREASTLVTTGNYGVFLFPESSVEGGRKKKSGERKGMQRFVACSITTYISIVEGLGRKAVVIPVAVSDGWKVLDHQTKRLTLEAFLAGLNMADPRIASMRVGSPIRSDEESLRNKNIEDYFGRLTASMLKPEERGIYG